MSLPGSLPWTFQDPLWLALLVPALALAWRWRGGAGPTRVLRLLVAAGVVVALADPAVRTSGEGRDLVVVVDRSRSMPSGSDEAAAELIALAEEARGRGDRVSVVAFGRNAALERLGGTAGRFATFEREIQPDASDLGGALDVALELIPAGRPGSICVVSDGEATGADPVQAARRAFGSGVRIDARALVRPAAADLAVERIDLPDEVREHEPFQIGGWVHADERTVADYTLTRGGEALASGRRTFEPGRTRLAFRDVLDRAGVASYELVLRPLGSGGEDTDAGPDRVPENDRAIGAVLVRGTRPLLVLNHDGAPDSLSEALRLAGVPVEVRAPEERALAPLELTSFRAVVLENVAAQRIGDRGLAALADFVVERGGGLALTGGKASFGVGGYHRSPIDPLLPVSMELRVEHKKQGVAMAIVLDTSGSMGAPAGAGTKMDLANQGAAAAIDLLTPLDAVGVLAVTSRAQVVHELVDGEVAPSLRADVLSIQAGGGGIYVRTGLLAAEALLADAPQENRHVILFADAADAEEQDGVTEILERLGRNATTVSVIALGSETDSDARFLENVATLGGGQVYFGSDPVDLPRMFAQDTLTVARSSFVDEPVAVSFLPDLFLLGELDPPPLGTVEGYNLNYARPGATVGALTLDEYRSPYLAFVQRGLGRTVALSGQVGGTYGARLVAWDGFEDLAVTLARWLLGQEEPRELFPRVRREGGTAIVEIELDPDAPTPPDLARLALRVSPPDPAAGAPREVPLERTGEHVLEARVPLELPGVSLATLDLGDGRSLALPPLVLPLSPEFERPLGGAGALGGERVLERLTSETGGALGVPAHALFRGPRHATVLRSLARELALAVLLLVLLEIAGRRLDLWPARGAGTAETARPRTRPEPPPPAAPAAPPPSMADALRSATRTARGRTRR